MEKKLNYFFNIEKNNPLILVGAGPSMHHFDYKKFKGRKMGVGTTILRLENRFKLDYFVSSNNEFPVPEIDKHLIFMNQFENMIWFFSDTACYDGIWTKSDEFLKNNLKLNYCFFDERHFNKKKCDPVKKCCNLINYKEETNNIYDLLAKKFETKIDLNYVNCTVAEHGLAIAILTGANPIFIQGIDLPKTNYQAHKKGLVYHGFNSSTADEMLNYTNKIIRKKLFKHYLKNFNIFPYLHELMNKINFKIKKKSRFSLDDLGESYKRFEYLSTLAKKNDQRIFVLSENSSLLDLQNFEYLNPDDVYRNYSNFF